MESLSLSDAYEPQEPIYYNYPIKSLLMKDYDIFTDSDEYTNIILCVYSVNTNGKYPFLQFLLSNNMFGTLKLPVLPISSSFNKDNMESYSKVYLSGLLQIFDFETFNDKIVFDGFYEFGQNLYLFFDLTKCDLNTDDIYSQSPVRFVISDEIVNHRNSCNIKIDDETVDFFVKNESINYLYDINKKQFEIPIVSYVGKSSTEKLNFVYTFGESAKNRSAMFGPYFYFTNFNYAIRQGGWSTDYKEEYIHDKLVTDKNGKYISGGIVRFALFTGNIKCIENMPNDTIDESDIKNERLNDPSLNNKNEVLTLRISDHDGLWTSSYDSIYLAKIELDDGSLIKEAPLIAVKEHNQQIPLSYHFINKSKLGEKYDPKNNDYSIV